MEDVEKIIATKQYHELSGDERVLVSELADNEEEFDQMKFVFAQMEAMRLNDKVEPRMETKRSLDSIFQETHQQRKGIWLNSSIVLLYPTEKPIYRRPLIQVAAAAILIFLAIPLFRNDLDRTQVQLAKNEIKTEKPEKQSEKKAEVTTDNDERVEVESPDPINTVISESKDLNQVVKGSSMITDKVLTSKAEALDFKNDDFELATATVTFSGALMEVAPVSVDHPDGVFVGDHLLTSMSAADQPELLDLLTVTF